MTDLPHAQLPHHIDEGWYWSKAHQRPVYIYTRTGELFAKYIWYDVTTGGMPHIGSGIHAQDEPLSDDIFADLVRLSSESDTTDRAG